MLENSDHQLKMLLSHFKNMVTPTSCLRLSFKEKVDTFT